MGQDETASNKELVLRYMKAAQADDVEGVTACWAEDCIRYMPRPGQGDVVAKGRDSITAKLSHAGLYTPGTLKMEVEHIMAEGPMVAIQFIISATTSRGEPYKNYYHHLFECHDGKIVKQWEYCDTLYGMRMLRPERLYDPAHSPGKVDTGQH